MEYQTMLFVSNSLCRDPLLLARLTCQKSMGSYN